MTVRVVFDVERPRATLFGRVAYVQDVSEIRGDTGDRIIVRSVRSATVEEVLRWEAHQARLTEWTARVRRGEDTRGLL